MHMSVHMSMHMSIHASIQVSMHMSTHMSIHTPAALRSILAAATRLIVASASLSAAPFVRYAVSQKALNGWAGGWVSIMDCSVVDDCEQELMPDDIR